jgi:hypothetical protein
MLPAVTATAIYTSNAAFSLSGSNVAIVGPSSAGPLVPVPITQPSQAITTFGGGPLPQWCAKAVRTKRLPVLAVRAASTAASAFSAVSRTTGHGTSAVTVGGSSATTVNALVGVLVYTGGTIGSAGITYRVTTDGGKTFGVTTSLGTANSIVVTLGSGNLTLEFAAGTLVAGELIQVTASVLAAGTYDDLDTSAYPGGTSNAVASATAGTYPDDDYELVIEFLQGGTLGTSGISYRTSLANGRTASDWGLPQNLGTSLAVVFPSTGGASLTLGTAGQTIATGAVLRCRTYAPNFNVGSITTALEALFKSTAPWEIALIAGPVDASMCLAIDAIFAANYAATPNGEKAWIASVRMPLAGETETEYRSYCQTVATAARSCYYGMVFAGDCRTTSAITGFLHKRPAALLGGIEQASVTPQIDIARTDRPGLGCQLSDDNGNPDCHDESISPGLDDMGYATLRSQPEGVYVTNPRIFSPAGTNVEMFPHRWVLNLHTRVAKNFFRKVLSNDLFAGRDGRILESDAKRLERGVNDAEEDTLKNPGYISAQLVTVSRTDQLLGVSPPTLTVSGQVQPKIYPKMINYTDQIVVSIANPR